jgi:phosphoglycolate phosphatase-like HAD superfamily hydrolase
MTKQEKLRENFVLNKYNRSEFYRDHHLNFGDVSKKIRQNFYDEADKDLNYLHSQGVVIKLVEYRDHRLTNKPMFTVEPLIEVEK